MAKKKEITPEEQEIIALLGGRGLSTSHTFMNHYGSQVIHCMKIWGNKCVSKKANNIEAESGELTLTKDRLIEMGFQEINGYLWYEWFPFALLLIEEDEDQNGLPVDDYWGLYCGQALLLTKVRTEVHLLQLFRAHKVFIPQLRNTNQ